MAPQNEAERANVKYPAPRRSDILWLVGGLLVVGVADVFRDVDWWFYAGGVLGFGGWEFTKWRMRRLAQEFDESRRSSHSHEQ